MSNVVLTVPHTQGRGFDATALLSAQIIQTNYPSASLLVANVPRDVCDQNRAQCREFPLRVRLRGVLRPSTFVLDVHSFPANIDRRRHWRGSELVILDDRLNGGRAPLVTVSYYNFMRGRGVDIQLLRGARNDIQEEAHQVGAESFLLEFNDGLSDTRRTQLARWTAQWLAERPRV